MYLNIEKLKVNQMYKYCQKKYILKKRGKRKRKRKINYLEKEKKKNN